MFSTTAMPSRTTIGPTASRQSTRPLPRERNPFRYVVDFKLVPIAPGLGLYSCCRQSAGKISRRFASWRPNGDGPYDRVGEGFRPPCGPLGSNLTNIVVGPVGIGRFRPL